MSRWPLEINGTEYKKIPASWIEADRAYDQDENAPESAVRLYAVSAAVLGGKAIRVRYLHPTRTKVKVLQTGACPRDDGDGYFPCGLKTPNGWERSIVPTREQSPDDVYRIPERDHMLDLWGDRLGLGDDETPAIADGGRAVRHLFDVEQGHLSPRFWREQR